MKVRNIKYYGCEDIFDIIMCQLRRTKDHGLLGQPKKCIYSSHVNLLHKSTISLIISGHDHDLFGYEENHAWKKKII